MQFAGDITKDDIRDALRYSVLDQDALSTLDDYDCSLEIGVTDELIPYFELTDPDGMLDIQFTTVLPEDDADMELVIEFEAEVSVNGIESADLTSAEQLFDKWYNVTTAAELISQTKFYPYNYFD